MAFESKEKIKDRMLKTAARLWGSPDIEVESNFDPIVKLLLDACSYEIEKISGDMEASHARMIEKMVEVILPDALIGIRPASGILHAQPNDKEYMLPSKKHFVTAKRITNPQTQVTETVTMSFSAIGQFALKNCAVRFMAANQKLFQLRDAWYKDVILPAKQASSEAHTIWLALEVKEGLNSLKGLNLYFDIRSEHQKELFFTLLKQVRCSIQGHEVRLKEGMSDEAQFTELNIDEVSDNHFRYNQKVCNHIYKLYQKHFLHLDSFPEGGIAALTTLPDELVQQFGETELKQKAPGNFVWVKMEFAPGLQSDFLESIFCNVNCFPVINRRQHDLSYKTQKFINIIPIDNKDYFFDIKSIVGGNAYEYHKRNLTTSDDLNDGEAILRSAGVGRFDSREAKETINYLLQVIRDETSTFSEIGGEAVAGRMKELHQVIARIEDQMKRFQHRGSSCYIMLKPKTDFETVFVEYWSSQGKIANDIRMGTRFQQENGSELQNNSMVLLSSTYGGKDKLNLEEKLNLFRKYLLSKDRIVSAEDIKIVCTQLFGNALKRVDVKKGVMTGLGKVEGFARCIDVFIYLQTSHGLPKDEIDYLINDLDVQLNSQSTAMFPYRIFLA